MWSLFVAQGEWTWRMFGSSALLPILLTFLAPCSALTTFAFFSVCRRCCTATFLLNALAPLALAAVMAPAISVSNGFDVVMIGIWAGGSALNATLAFKLCRW